MRPPRGQQEETKAQVRLGYERLQAKRIEESVVTFKLHSAESLAAYRRRVETAAHRRKGGEW